MCPPQLDLLTSGTLDALELATLRFHTGQAGGVPPVRLDEGQTEVLQKTLLDGVGTEYDTAMAVGALCDSLQNAIARRLLVLAMPSEAFFEPVVVCLLAAPCGHLLVEGLPRMPELTFLGVTRDVRGLIGFGPNARHVEYQFGVEIRVDGKPLQLADLPALKSELTGWAKLNPAAVPGCTALLRALDELYGANEVPSEPAEDWIS